MQWRKRDAIPDALSWKTMNLGRARYRKESTNAGRGLKVFLAERLVFKERFGSYSKRRSI